MSLPAPDSALSALARLLARAAAREWPYEQASPAMGTSSASTNLEDQLNSNVEDPTHGQKIANLG